MNSRAAPFAVLVCLAAFTPAQAQTSRQANQTTFDVNVVSRTTRAVKYEHRSGKTQIDFHGTNLMPRASGEATIESKRGAMEVHVTFKGLDNPTSFGTEYLTYVMWAISPEGRSVNMGEVLVGDNHRSKLEVTTDLQAFALIVTAEPYYAVRRPSNVVIAENAIRSDTVGTTEAVDAKYELIDRGGYIPTGYHMDPVVLNSKLPLEFFEARNAVRIARAAGAESYAASSYEKAESQMKQAENLGTMKHVDRNAVIAASRQVVQTADDSREIAVKRMDADRASAARDSEAAKLASARARSTNDTRARLDAEAATADANRRRAEADKATTEAQRLQQDAQADSDRNRAVAVNANQAVSDAQQAQRSAEADSDRNRAVAVNANQAVSDAQQAQRSAEADSDRNRAVAVNANQAVSDAQQAQRSAEADSDRNRAVAVNANQAVSDAQQAQRSAEADSDRNRLAAATSDQQLKQAVRNREALRAKLLQQFNLIVATRDTARGLIVNLSDVVFDTGKSTLRPGAREKLAKISGIVLAYPDLRLAIEGNTDSVGGDAMNQRLSEQRADSVRDYLLHETIPAASMTSRGLGKTQPVATNDTAEGRQQNRRVELVVSGEIIGTAIGVISQNLPATQR
jgi:outer membrane protein OmpA-like peptidoglycan-associated protein